MVTENSQPTVNFDSGDLGEVLAVVEKPPKFNVPERTWKHETIFTAVAMAAGVGPVSLAVPLVVLAASAIGRNPGTPGSTHVTLIDIADAKQLIGRNLLFFPNGGPSIGSVYGRHPLRVRDYLPYANFHRVILNEKSIEIARYLLSLGATDVEISCDQNLGHDAKAHAQAPAPKIEDISLTMGFGRDSSGKLSIKIGGAGKRSKTPPDLIWPRQDAVFRLAHDAAHAGASTFHFGLRSERSGSVNAAAALKLHKDLGLDLGGEYKRWEDLSFTVDAEF